MGFSSLGTLPYMGTAGIQILKRLVIDLNLKQLHSYTFMIDGC